jgi:hypothetical protein
MWDDADCSVYMHSYDTMEKRRIEYPWEMNERMNRMYTVFAARWLVR